MDCCSNDFPDPGANPDALPAAAPPPQRSRRFAVLIQWALPVTTLALIPKCPACVAAYALLFTGIGLSLPAAAAIRWTIICLSAAALAYLLVRATRRALSPSA